MEYARQQFDVAIAGGGPAGSSAAIRLVLNGARVLLLEEKKFPRPKLCGEFISPECLTHFRELGVIDQMLAAGATTLDQTVFYSTRGKQLTVPSEWFKFNTAALGLSRSEMDYELLNRARNAGAIVIENAHAADLIFDREQVCGVKVRTGNTLTEYLAHLTIDATGRNRSLARRLDRIDRQGSNKRRRSLVAFKAHFENTAAVSGTCEIYSYPGGYGGLSAIEGGASNLCFIASADDVRRNASNPDRVMREVVMRNARAARTLANARLRSPWLSVSLEGFGRRSLAPARGLLTIGDAASFIDPFTGSGMLMAMESGQVAAETITFALGGAALESVSRHYEVEYEKQFNKRLRVSSLLRRAAFVPYLADAAIYFLSLSPRLRRTVARATRQSREPQPHPSVT